MKKVLAIVLCLVLVLSLAACGSSEEELKARYDEGYKVGYEEGTKAGKAEGEKAGAESGYKTGYEEGKKAGYEEGAKAGNEESYQAGYDEGVVVGKDEGYKAGKDEGYQTGYDEGHMAGYEEGKASTSSAQKYARFSGSFTATVEKILPDYSVMPDNVLLVHFFQDAPFLIRFSEPQTGKFQEGKVYVFEFDTFDVPVAPDAQYADIKDYMYSIEVKSYRLAKDDEMGLASKTPTVEFYTK